MWQTLGIDDAEQALFAQEFSWSYRTRAPPLFTWLLIGARQGSRRQHLHDQPDPLRAARRHLRLRLRDRAAADRAIPRLSALAVYSFAAIYMFAFYSHHDLTHTTMMTAMLAVAWYVFVRLAASPTPRLVSRARRRLRARASGQMEFRHVRGGAAARLPAPPRLSASGADLEDRSGRDRLRADRPADRRAALSRGPPRHGQRPGGSRRRRRAPISRASRRERCGSSHPCSPIRSRSWC